MSAKMNLRVGIAGLGAVGLEVAKRLVDGIDGLTLAAVAVRDADKGRRNLPQIGDMIALRTLDTLADDCDVVVESLPPVCACCATAVRGGIVKARRAAASRSGRGCWRCVRGVMGE